MNTFFIINKSPLGNILFYTIFLFFITSAFGQYHPFYASERELSNYTYYQEYLDLIEKHNSSEGNEEFTDILDEMDSLANTSLQELDGLQYLFFKNEIANLYRSKSKFPEAYDVLKSSMKTFAHSYDTIHMEYVSSLRLLRTTLFSLTHRPGGFEHSGRSVKELFVDMFAVMEALGEEGEPLRNTLVDYGMALFREGNTSEAIQTHYRARTLALEAHDLASLAMADYNIMSNVKTTHDLLQTQNEVLKKNIELFESKAASIPVLFYTAFYLTKVSQNYFHYLFNTDQAIFHAEKAIALLDTLRFPSHNIKAATHGNLALYYSEAPDTSKVWSHIAQARDILISQPMSHYNRAFAYVLMADAAVTLSTDSTFAYLSILDTLEGKRFFTDKLIEVEAKAHQQKGNYEKMADLILSGFEEYEVIGEHKVPIPSTTIEPLNQFYFLNLLERAYRKQEAETQENFTPSIVALIQQQNEIFQTIVSEDIFGFETTTGLAHTYNEFLESALSYMFAPEAKDYTDEKIQLAFSSKSMHLSNLMAKKQFQSLLESDTDMFSRLLGSSLEVQNSRNRLAAVQESDMEDSEEVYQHKMDLNSKLIAYFMLKYEISSVFSDEVINQFQESFEIASLKSIQSILEKDEALLEFYILENSWAQILVLPDTLISIYHSDSDILPFIERERRALLTGRQTTELGSILFKEIMPYLKQTQKLVIIPDKDLHHVPFESMKMENRMLIEHYSISYSYSATLWHNLRKQHPHSAPSNMLTIAPLFMDSLEINIPVLASHYRGNEALDALPFSLEEIKGIGAIMQSSLHEIVHLYAENASLPNIKKHIESFDIIHFATHGIANPMHPERSGIYLFQSPENKKQITGFLSLGEVYNMNLNTNLVVLSSCNTGRGKLMQGEGVIALPRGFILAGVPQVLAALWKVHDERTKDIMLLFYENIAQGHNYRDALRMAKLQAIEKGFLPMDWAGFVLIGS